MKEEVEEGAEEEEEEEASCRVCSSKLAPLGVANNTNVNCCSIEEGKRD